MNSIHLMMQVRLAAKDIDFSTLEAVVCRLFPQMYSDETEIAHFPAVRTLLSNFFPEWDSAWKRQALRCISKIKPNSSPSVSKPKM